MAVIIGALTVTFASHMPVLILRRAPRLPGRLLGLNFHVNVFQLPHQLKSIDYIGYMYSILDKELRGQFVTKIQAK